MNAKESSFESQLSQMNTLFSDAEATLKKSMGGLMRWTEETETLLRDNPGALLAAAAASGFVSGTLLRNRFGGSAQKKQKFDTDPTLLLAGGLLLGMLAGPKLLERIFSTGSTGSGKAAHVVGLPTSQAPASQSSAQKPFEKI